MSIMTIVVAVMVLGILVIIHEFGHFVVSKIFGIKVNEFSVGMGPRLFGFKKGETSYSIRFFPIGGYVKTEGEEERSDDPRAFNKKPILIRFLVIIAGPFMNFLLAFLFIALIFAINGVNLVKIDSVEPGSPAQEVGLKKGDIITGIGPYRNIDSTELFFVLEEYKNGESIRVLYKRDGKVYKTDITPFYDEERGRYRFGFTIVGVNQKSFLLSVKHAFGKLVFFVSALISFLVKLIIGQASTEQVGGPVAMVSMLGQVAKAGLFNLMYFAAFLSINLGVFNLLPIPALDGSKLIFLAIEGIRGKPVPIEKEALVHFIGFAILIFITILVTIKDIRMFF